MNVAVVADKALPYRRSIHTIDLDDVPAIVAELRRMHTEAWNACSDWRDTAGKCIRYRDGYQRPVGLRDNALYLIFNLIIHRALTKLGILNANKPRPVADPIDGADILTAECIEDLIVKDMKEDHFDRTTQRVSMDEISVGLGVYHERIEPGEKRWTTRGRQWGKLRCGSCHPLEFSFDKSNGSPTMTGDGAGWYYTRVTKIAVEKLYMEFPEKSEEFDTLGEDDNGLASDTELERGRAGKGKDFSSSSQSETSVLRGGILSERTKVEVYYKKEMPVFAVWRRNESGRFEPTENEDGSSLTYEQYQDIVEQDPSQKAQLKVFRVIDKEVWRAAYVGDVLLYNEKSPYEHNQWEHVFFGGFMTDSDPMPHGEVERLVDIQDLFNRLITLFVENSIRMANSGLLIDEDAFSAQYTTKQIEGAMRKPGWRLFTKKGRLKDAMGWMEPPGAQQDIFNLADAIRILFDELSSLANVQRGGMPYDTSGKAILALQRAGDTALTYLYGGLEMALTEWGQRRMSNLVQFTTFRDAWRISDAVRDKAYKIVAEKVDPGFIDQWKKIYGAAINENPPPEISNAVHLVQYPDKEQKPKILVTDLSAVHMDIAVTLGSGIERSEEDKMKVVELVFGATKDVEYLLRELEINGWPEILKRTEERDQLRKAGEQYVKIAANEQAAPVLRLLSTNPEIITQALATSGIDIAALSQAAQQAVLPMAA